MIKVSFHYQTGLTRSLFDNVRLTGSWNDWAEIAMQKVIAEDGCEAFVHTVAFGTPSDEVRKVYGVVDKAQVAGIAALDAGRTGEEVDAAARKVIEDAGYGAYFTHRLGHGLGMDGHEQPYLVKGNRKPLVAGNTVTIEPGVYLPGKFGVRIEDDYGVRDKGAIASLSVRPTGLVILGG